MLPLWSKLFEWINKIHDNPANQDHSSKSSEFKVTNLLILSERLELEHKILKQLNFGATLKLCHEKLKFILSPRCLSNNKRKLS